MIITTNKYNNPYLDQTYVLKRTFTQILDIIRFEVVRNLKKTLLILLIFMGIFSIFFAFNIYTFSNPNNVLPDLPRQYIQGSFLSSIALMILILAILFGSSIIVEDFEHQTGNLIFPNVTKFRLMFSRVISGFVLGSVSLVAYYLLITLDVIYEYGLSYVPIELFYSLFWSLMYYFTLLSFTVLFSSFSKSTSLVIILLLVFVLVVLNVMSVLVAFAGYTGEPIYNITFFGNIITQLLTYPASRSVSQHLNYINVKIYQKELTFFHWLSPTPIEALIFMIGYSAIFLIVSYYLYERRQVQ